MPITLRGFAARGVVATTAMTMSSVAAAQTTDPFPDPIRYGDTTASLVPFAEVPGSEEGEPPRLHFMAPAYDGSGRVFVSDQRGPLWTIDDGGDLVEEYLNVADFDPELTGGFEGGLQSFAFHPDFAENGKLYTVHGSYETAPAPTFRSISPDPQLHMVLLEWTDDAPYSNTFEGGEPKEVMRIEQAVDTHYGGGLTFNYAAEEEHPDYGRLFLTVGDGGEPEASQQLDVATGSVLRIDPLGVESRNGRYGVPEDNPFVGEPGALPELWASGFRNPQRIAFDPAGQIDEPLISDVGESTVEEINVGYAGDNYGWPFREGSFEHLGEEGVGFDEPCDEDFTDPIAEYDHDEGAAVTAGYIVRGEGPESLQGSYLFGDIPTGRIFYFDTEPDDTAHHEGVLELQLLDNEGELTTFLDLLDVVDGAERADLRFGLGEEGEIFVLNKQDGIVRMLVNAEPASEAVPEPTAVVMVMLASGFAFALRRRR